MESLPSNLSKLDREIAVNPLLPEECKAFGEGATNKRVKAWLKFWQKSLGNIDFCLVLAGSRTAEVEGISAAGATPASRKYTAIADAEFLLKGPSSNAKWPLPPLESGITPALISYVALQRLGLSPLVIPIGLTQEPVFSHIAIEQPPKGPASCLSTGHAMKISRVEDLWEKGLLMGRRLFNPLLIAECVPGGTTTAQAVLTGLGLPISDFISGSLRNPPVDLKRDLVTRGLKAAGFEGNSSPKKLLAAVGDPFQPFTAGLLIGAREARQQVLLGGGSQMLAIIALALSVIPSSSRQSFVDGISIATTSWLLDEPSQKNKSRNAMLQLTNQVGNFFEVSLMGFASGLRFDRSSYKVLRDYEDGYVKEGVGAGALAFLAQLHGASRTELVDSCEKTIFELNKIKV